MGAGAIKDPHLRRMVEAVAYLNARIRCKLDDDFPELTEALLGVLYPHYLAPIPAMAVVQLKPQPGQTAAVVVDRHTPLETDPIDGEPCQFRTCYPVKLWPVQVESATLSGRPLRAPRVAGSEDARTVLHLVLSCLGQDLTFAELAPKRLRFFCKGQETQALALYDLLLNAPLQVAAAGIADDPNPVLLKPSALQPVGFGAAEGALPYPPRTFPGYRLLTEFFTFRPKFLFLDLLLPEATVRRIGGRLDLFIYLRHGNPDLENNLTADNFALGCTPIVNLFRQRAEAIPLDHSRYEHEVVPDRRRRQVMEVYAIDGVTATDDSGQVQTFQPFYGLHDGDRSGSDKRYWHARRRPGRHLPGTETFLTVTDLGLQPFRPDDRTLSVETTCINRRLRDPTLFVGREVRFHPRAGGAPLAGIECLVPPTATLYPPTGEGALWRLISHLSLNHLSLGSGEEGTRALREILKLYDFEDSQETRAMIDSITAVDCQPDISRILGEGLDSVCRGTRVTLRFDETRFAGKGLFLFASILERFLALYCSINSFVRLRAETHGGRKVLHQWPPRAGDHPLL
jgi:type VI secretion system protein ImpG